MNERIRALWNQSRYPSGRGHDEEKFALLIVRECMECSDPLIRHYIDKHPEQEQALLLAAIADYQARLKKHFEVEHD